MIAWLKNSTVCIRINRNWMSVRVVHPGRSTRYYESSTAVILQANSSSKVDILAIGREAERFQISWGQQIKRGNAFDHPRLLVDDPDLAALTLTHFIGKALQKTIFFTPRMIIQPLRSLEGGLTNLEKRSLIEIAMMAGAREVFLQESTRDFTDEELLTSQPSDFQFKRKI